MTVRYLFFFSFFCYLCACSHVNDRVANTAAQDSILLLVSDTVNFSKLDTLHRKIKWAMLQQVPVLRCQDSLNNEQRLAEEVALSDSIFLKDVRNENGEPYRCEIFGVYPAKNNDWPAAPLQFDFKGCFRVEMYNYALNSSTVSIVDIRTSAVLHRIFQMSSQPDIPAYLKKMAIAIAANSLAVQRALGLKPGESDALMASTKTALNRSRCERSRHLCVAPTFVYQNKALWAIVDLTSFSLSGIRWTNTGDMQPDRPLTEKKLQDEKLMRCYCDKINTVNQQGWQMEYMLTSSDGLRIANVKFNNKPVLSSAKLVDWHVSYSNTDGFGYSDAIGCPYFSQAAVVAINEPIIAQMQNENGRITGFALEQTFKSEGWPKPCNYNYRQRFEFYKDGSFRVAAASVGRGCGNDGTYRPVFRIAFAQPYQQVNSWEQNNWRPWKNEGWILQQETTEYFEKNYLIKITKQAGEGFYLSPSRGQFADGGRGDKAYIYATIQKKEVDEGESDLTTIGPCCNTDYKQGPEKFFEPLADSLGESPLVIWYVPQLKNSDVTGKEYCWAKAELKNGVYVTREYPCFGGPLFVPIDKVTK